MAAQKVTTSVCCEQPLAGKLNKLWTTKLKVMSHLNSSVEYMPNDMPSRRRHGVCFPNNILKPNPDIFCVFTCTQSCRPAAEPHVKLLRVNTWDRPTIRHIRGVEEIQLGSFFYCISEHITYKYLIELLNFGIHLCIMWIKCLQNINCCYFVLPSTPILSPTWFIPPRIL